MSSHLKCITPCRHRSSIPYYATRACQNVLSSYAGRMVKVRVHVSDYISLLWSPLGIECLSPIVLRSSTSGVVATSYV